MHRGVILLDARDPLIGVCRDTLALRFRSREVVAKKKGTKKAAGIGYYLQCEAKKKCRKETTMDRKLDCAYYEGLGNSKYWRFEETYGLGY